MVEPEKRAEKVREVIKAGTGPVKKEEKAPEKKEEPKGKKEKVIGFFKKGVRKRCPSCGWVGTTEHKKCPSCKSNLVMERGPVGYLMSFLIFLGIIFGSLIWFFTPFFSLLNATVGAFISPYVIILLIAFIPALLWSKGSMTKGVIYCIFFVVILGIAFPLVAGVSAVFGGGVIEMPGGGTIDGLCFVEKLTSGDIMGIQGCFITEKKGPPVFGPKSYESLKINLGTKIRGTYVISTIFANDQYSFDVSLLNSNLKGSGLKISNIKMDNVKIFKNKNMTECSSYDSIDNLCPFKASFDDCLEGNPCTLNPEEEKVLSADLGTIPCKINFGAKSLRYLTFYVNATYEQNVTHKKTLGVAASYEDVDIFKSNANLRKDVYETEPPSDGPVDLLIDFDSPYYLGKRSDNKIKMYVWIENKGSGKLRQLDKIVIEPIGEFPDWLNLTESDKCERNGNRIELKKFGEGFFRLSKPIKYTCNLKVVLENYPGYAEGNPAVYQTVKFQGVLRYEYMETKSSEPQKIDRTDC